ncbi:MAG: peptidylprolyl isomerase [bacterium]|nr:peptidylprolyl isomerase [bacterium]
MAEKNKEAKGVSNSPKKKTNTSSLGGVMAGSKKGKIATIMENKLYLVLATVVLMIILMLGVFSVGIYKFSWNDDATMEVARIVPYPAFFVNGTPITYAKYQDYQKAYSTYITEFYIKGEKKIDVNSDEAKKTLVEAKSRIKELLVKNAIVRNEVKKRNIKYTQKEIDDSFNDFVKRTGGETEVKNNLKKYYGLTIEKFKSEFYIDTFLNGKLQNAIQDDKSLNADAEKKANEVLAKVKAGEDFAELAKKYSEDTTAAKGGDLGSVKKGQLVPEFEDALWKLQVGQTSDLVKTVYGYHIIKLTAINGEERTASHILIKTKDFDTWMADQVKNAKVKYWIK